MMSGLLLLFILIMAVCLMQAQKNYTEKLAEQAKLIKSQDELDESRKQIAEQQQVLREQETELENQRTAISQQESELISQRTAMAQQESELENQEMTLAEQAKMLERMAKANWQKDLEGDLAVETVYSGTILIPAGELLDKEAEIAKLEAEEKRLNGEIRRSHGILGNEGFMKKAPAFKIEEEKRKLTDYEKQLSAVTERLAFLRK